MLLLIYSSLGMLRKVKKYRERHTELIGEVKYAYKILVGKSEQKKSFYSSARPTNLVLVLGLQSGN
jgi:hypothetical protein